jgi:hypothetical protein
MATSIYYPIVQGGYSENLLNVNSMFNTDLSWNVTAGTALITQVSDRYFKSSKSLKIENLDSGVITEFNTATDLGFTAHTDGNYIFSYRLFFDVNLGDDPVFAINFFKNGLPFESIGSLHTAGDPVTNEGKEGRWICWAQSIALNEGDIITYTFTFNAGGYTSIIWLDGLKCELDNGTGDPTDYTPPKDYCCSDDKGYQSASTTGWGYYADSLATPTININTSYTQITIDALGANITDYLPKEIRGISELWTDNKITPVSIGDDFDGRFDLTVTSKTGSPSLIEVIIDISGGVAGTNKVFTGYINTVGSPPYDQSLPLDYFSLATFLSNGGKLYAKTDTGSVTIGRRNIKISRKSKYIE